MISLIEGSETRKYRVSTTVITNDEITLATTAPAPSRPPKRLLSSSPDVRKVTTRPITWNWASKAAIWGFWRRFSR